MTARIIDGKQRATDLRHDIATAVEHLRNETGVTPKLVTILVGKDPPSAIYVRRKGEQASAVGMHTESHRLDSSITEAELMRSEEHTSEVQSLMRISYAVFCSIKKTITNMTST